MKVIVISGSHSGVGKTQLAEEVLHRRPNWSALKITVSRKRGCPRDAGCGVCEGLIDDFEVVSDKKMISKNGTDTARMKKAGAKKVIWLKTTMNGLKKGLKKALLEFGDAEGVVIEGTSVLKYIRPDLSIFLRDRMLPLRSNAKKALNKADIIIDVKK